MSQDGVDAQHVAYGYEEDDVFQDDEPTSSQPKTPLHRPVPVDAMYPPRRRNHRPKPLRRFETISSLGESDSQGTPHRSPTRGSRRTFLPSYLRSDDLPRLSQSDLPFRTAMRTPRKHRLATVAKDTPLALRMTANKHTMNPNRTKDIYHQTADEGMKVIIGPMPVEEFLDEFLPAVDETEMPDPTGAFDDVPAGAEHEEEIYPKLIRAINDFGRCPGLTFVDTSVKPERKGRAARKPDITAYNEDDVLLLEKVESKTKPGVFRTAANLGLAETFWEVKVKGSDCFNDNHGDSKHFFDWVNHPTRSPAWESRKSTFGQVVSYASEGCARQHRHSYLSTLIIGGEARFFRWDRAGTVVTRAFNYQQNPELLCRYLWRFSQADMNARGFDPTVTVASEDETRLFESAVSEEVAFQKGIDVNDKVKVAEELKKHYQQGKVTKITVQDSSRSTAGEYLVSVPVRSPVSSVGRSCRGYWTTKVEEMDDGSLECEVGFLKDVWRLDLPGLTSEGSVLSEMEGTVPNIPQLDCFGDCPDDPPFYSEGSSDEDDAVIGASGEVQATKTQNYIHKEWVSKSCRVLPEQSEDNLSKRIVKHVHFRMISKNVGYPLTNFTDARELFLALNDALEALVAAYRTCNRLHRDVSLENIILCRFEEGGRRLGILIDWEFSVLADGSGRAGDYFRSGTWAYMSSNILARPINYRHSHQDDLESLFYISLYCALRWLPHNENKKLGLWMFEFFDHAEEGDNGDTEGGHKKLSYKMQPTKFSRQFVFKNEHINYWFEKAYLDLSTHLLIQTKHMKWTDKNVQRHMRIVCEGLSSENQPGISRVEHSVADRDVIQEQPVCWATHTSIGTISQLSGTAELQAGPSSKRSRSAFEEPSGEPHPQTKRSRLSIQEIESDHLSSTAVSEDDSDIEERKAYIAMTPDEYYRDSREQLWRHELGEDLSHLPRLPSDDDDGLIVSYSDT